MDSLVITGIPPYDGEYPLDFGAGLTNRELHTIKQISGVRAGELNEALNAGDYDLIVALAAILITRAGHQPSMDALWDAPMEAIQFKEGEPEAEDRPPAKATTGGGKNDSAVVAEQT